MATVNKTELTNGLPLFRIGIEGTRAVTIIVAFDAGSRRERPEENGIAHFLEHMVFKGGQDYPTYREVNSAAELLGARMNAFTGTDLVAFHITARADRILEAAELLTDFTARPQVDAAELDKERGVVIQEIARSHDQPSSRVDELIGEAAFGDHPLGRSVLGTEERLRAFDRQQVLDFRRRTWAGAKGGVFLIGNPAALSADGSLDQLFERYPAVEPADPALAAPQPAPQTLVEQRDSKQSHLRLGYRPDLDPMNPSQRAALTIYATLLGGSAGSRLFEEIREQRGLAYSVRAEDYPLADAAVFELSAGLDSSHCIEAYRRMREIVVELASDGPTEEEVERARAYAAGRRVISFEGTTAVARAAVEEHLVFGSTVDPDEIIARLDGVSYDEVSEVARSVSDQPAVACVGPHEVEDFGKGSKATRGRVTPT